MNLVIAGLVVLIALAIKKKPPRANPTGPYDGKPLAETDNDRIVDTDNRAPWGDVRMGDTVTLNGVTYRVDPDTGEVLEQLP